MWAKVAMVLYFGLAAMATGYEYEYEYEGSSTTAKKFELPDALFVPYTAYTYNYTVEALSSVPDEMKTLTGMRISCTLDVTIEPAEESRSALLRLRNCDVSVVNEDQAKHGNTPFVMLSAERFTRVDSIAAVGARMQTHLHKPIAFQYQRGSVGETKTREDDPPWSVNIKKGVLSLLQTSTKEARDQRLFETDAMGVCESAYVYSTQPPYNGRLRDSATVLRVLNITKSRIYSNCSKEPLVYTTFPFSEGVGVMNSTAHVDYNVAIVDDGKPVVERVYARSQHIFAPFGYDHGYLSASTHQLLELASFASFTQSSPLPAGLTKTTSVEMEQPQESFGENLPSAKNKVHSLLADLREAHAAGKREHAGCTLISLVDELKKLDLAGFKEVLKLNEREEGTPSEPEERQRQRRFLIDLLPTVGSRHAVRMMKELLKSDKTAERVLSLVPLLNFLMPPHPTVLPEVAVNIPTS